MKKYESIFIVDVKKVDDEGKGLQDELSKFIESKSGKVLESDNLGRKLFARNIRGSKGGIYLNIIFETDPENIALIKKKFSLDNRIIRIFIINYDRPEEPESEKVQK